MFVLYKINAFDLREINKIIWKEILWKYSIQSLKTTDSVWVSLLMADVTSLMPPSFG